MNNKTLKITMTALFASMICVGTMAVRIPISSTGGYINLGDCIVLISGILLGPLYGGISAGIGSALADLFSGYVFYIPGTFLIKCFMAAIMGIFVTDLSKKMTVKVVIFGAIAECAMIIGYCFYESVILGYGVGAIAAIPGNCIQGIINFILVIVLVRIFRNLGIPMLRK